MNKHVIMFDLAMHVLWLCRWYKYCRSKSKLLSRVSFVGAIVLVELLYRVYIYMFWLA